MEKPIFLPSYYIEATKKEIKHMGIVQVSIARNEFIRGIHIRLFRCITIAVSALSVDDMAQIQFQFTLFSTGFTFGLTQEFRSKQAEEKIENQ